MVKNHEASSPITRIFKGVGYLTALLTLAFGVSRAWVAVDDYRERRRQVDALLAAAELQMLGADYPGAWDAVGEAEQIGPSDAVRRRREDIAMAWLRDMRVPSGGTFTEAVSPLVPVVTRGAAESEGVRRADLLAHVGWAGFLRFRDGGGAAPDFERYYTEALAIDPENPYANAFRGHWALWPPASMGDALGYFDAARRSGREVGFVRRLQLAGLTNSLSLENRVELVRMAADLSGNPGETPDDFARTVWSRVYETTIRDEALREAVLDAVPPSDHAAVFQSFFGPGSRAWEEGRWERDLWLAYILDRDGRRPEAVALLRQTPRRSASGGELSGYYQELIDQAISRFEAPGP